MPSRIARWLLAAFVLASACAPAVTLNPRGIGQVLIYPYYTVNRGQDTLVSLVNTASIGKLVRVRFLEGYNGRTVFSTYVFLSAHDIWTAAITQVADDGGARLVTSDRSCTYPVLDAGNAAFVSTDYDGTNDSGDTGPTSITRTREGSIEFIEAGDVVPGSAAELAITHVQNGTPGAGTPTCDFAAAPAAPIDLGDLAAPTGGLYGSGSIVDVVQGTFFAYPATALTAFTGAVTVDDLTDETQPSLDDADGHAVVSLTGGATIALDFERGIDAVSAVLMADAIDNEFLLDASVGANTDWVITFPTKRRYVDPRLTHATLEPFAITFGDYTAGHSETSVIATTYDREELASGSGPPPDGCGIPCVASPPIVLDYQVNVMGFLAEDTPVGTPTPVLGSRLSTFYTTGWGQPPRPNDGWIDLDLYNGDAGHVLPGGTSPQHDGVFLLGLPVTGFMVYNIVNANAQPGILGNYSGAFAHRSTEACVGDVPECPPQQPPPPQ